MKRTADPRSKPFEIRSGIGMPGFRGMRTEGDPSFLPPTKFRFLQNVRLGSGDVQSRPGLSLFDTLDAPATWLTEISEQVQSATLYMGPASRWNQLGYELPDPPGTDMIANYSRHDFSRIAPGSGASPDGNEASSLFGLFPKYDSAPTDLWMTWSMCCGATPYGLSDDNVSDPPPLTTTWGSVEPFSLIPSVGFFQNALCIDPVVKWQDREGNDRWLCAGQFRGDIFTGVGNYEVPYYTVPLVFNAAVGDPTVGGQPIFEVNFDTRNPLDRLVLLGFADSNLFSHTQLFSGGLTEVFRMPPPGYKEGCRTIPAPVPTAAFDPAMYTEGQWVRSMVSVGRRADDILTDQTITEETLYLGTVGGKVIATDGDIAGVPDPTVKWGRNDPSDGAVWSYDGITLEQQLDAAVSPAGQWVCVAKTGDGGVIAAGRDRAAFLSEKGAAWVSVTYVPAPTIPFSSTNSLLSYDIGYCWLSRADFQGEIYFYGYDIGAGSDPGPAPPQGPNLSIPARLVLAKFDPGTLTITVVRTGAAFDQAVVHGQVLDIGMEYERIGSQPQAVLASTGNRLFYMSAWSADPSGDTTFIGEYDGVSFDDNKYGFSVASGGVPSDMVAAGQAIWPAFVPFIIWKIQNGVVTKMLTSSPSAIDRPSSRIFVGP